MKRRQQKQQVSRCNKKPSTLVYGKGNSSEPIPLDITIEIFTRLHVKSLARCRCLSKLWSSILASPYFTDLCLIRSMAHPKLLFACKKDNHLFFFSSPQLQNPQNSDEEPSLVALDYHMKFPFDSFSKVCDNISGLVCLKQKEGTVLMICNPSTGQLLTLPKVKTNKTDGVMSYFGYDPIDKQFKLLSMTRSYSGPSYLYGEHQILTLGNKDHSWRMIECNIRHIPTNVGICINGVLYYPAVNERKNDGIVCFDIRSEKFRFIEEAKAETGKLVNYKGKLSILKLAAGNLELSILEDDIWSTHTYVLPLMRDDNGIDAKFARLYIIGVTRLGEIVLSLRSTPYLFYYNIERNTLIKVEIQGMDVFPGYGITTFLDHVEDMKLGGMFKTL